MLDDETTEVEDIEEDDEFQFSAKHRKIFSDLRTDFKTAKKSKVEIDKLITGWNDIYEGKVTKKIPANRSKLVMKEVAKQIEWQKPNITEPFVSTQNPIRLSGPNQARARIMQKYANMHFTGSFDRDSFTDQLSDVLLREGTVWVKSGWLNEEETIVKKYDSISLERLVMMNADPDVIEQNEDGTFKVEFHSVRSKTNEATAEIQRNENVFPDPSARTRAEMDWIMVRRYETVDSLRATGLYDEEALEKLVAIGDDDNTESSLASQRNKDDEYYGYDKQFKRANSKKVSIIEYWGMADINGDGKPVQILAEWAEKQEIDLRIEENPMPSKEIPFHVSVYSSRPFSIWGNGLAFFLGDSQDIKSGLMRGVMDNLSSANNGQTFAMRGSMDYVNFKRWRNGDRHIIVNKHPKESLHEGNFNNLPPSVFNALQMIDSEIEKLSGTQAGGPALSNSSLAKDDTGDMQLTMAQQRMASTVRNVSNLISKIVKEWIVTAEHWLDDEQIEMMFTDSEQADMNAFRDSGTMQVKLKVGTEVTRTMQTQQLNMLLQQSKALQETMPPEQLNSLVAEMYELFDMYEDAEKVRTYRPEPTELEIAQQQLEIQKLQLANAKTQAEINELNAKAQTHMADAQATVQYKTAQTAEKYAKAEATKIDSTLAPVKQLSEMSKVSQIQQN